MLPFGLTTVVGNYLVWCVHQSLQCCKEGWHTINEFLTVFNWSMQACWTGYWPEVGPYGEPLTGRRKQMAGMKLCDGFYFVLWALIGDLDYLTKTYLLPNATSNKPCCWCPCNSDNVPWWDFRIKAKWVKKVWTREAWEVSGWKQCPIFNLPGVSLLSVYPDWMHIKTLGIDKVLLGSTLWVLIHWIVPESLGDLECRLAFVWGEIFEEYERQGTQNRYTVIKLSMFTTKSRGEGLRSGVACSLWAPYE